jgi:YbbR domain-containing protein
LNGAGTTVNPPKANVSGRQLDINRVDHLTVQIQIQHYDPNKVLQNLIVQPKDAAGQPVTGVDIDPATVDVHPVLIAANNQKDVYISPTLRGQPAPGYEVTAITTNPPDILISGEDVGQVNIINTDPINIDKLDKDKTFLRVKLRQPKDYSVDLTRNTVRVIVRIKKSYVPKTPPAPVIPPVSQVKSTTQVTSPSVLAH